MVQPGNRRRSAPFDRVGDQVGVGVEVDHDDAARDMPQALQALRIHTDPQRTQAQRRIAFYRAPDEHRLEAVVRSDHCGSTL